VLRAVPNEQREAALALGATRWETTRIAVLRYGRSGLIGAVLLGLGRALGETMAVTMVIGNRPEISASLFAPGYTMASVIANEFTEATSDLYVSALIEVALLLLVITVIVNAAARLLVWSVGGPVKEVRE
jgi:phosphate transport system permease protein